MNNSDFEKGRGAHDERYKLNKRKMEERMERLDKRRDKGKTVSTQQRKKVSPYSKPCNPRQKQLPPGSFKAKPRNKPKLKRAPIPKKKYSIFLDSDSDSDESSNFLDEAFEDDESWTSESDFSQEEEEEEEVDSFFSGQSTNDFESEDDESLLDEDDTVSDLGDSFSGADQNSTPSIPPPPRETPLMNDFVCAMGKVLGDEVVNSDIDSIVECVPPLPPVAKPLTLPSVPFPDDDDVLLQDRGLEATWVGQNSTSARKKRSRRRKAKHNKNEKEEEEVVEVSAPKLDSHGQKVKKNKRRLDKSVLSPAQLRKRMTFRRQKSPGDINKKNGMDPLSQRSNGPSVQLPLSPRGMKSPITLPQLAAAARSGKRLFRRKKAVAFTPKLEEPVLETVAATAPDDSIDERTVSEATIESQSDEGVQSLVKEENQSEIVEADDLSSAILEEGHGLARVSSNTRITVSTVMDGTNNTKLVEQNEVLSMEQRSSKGEGNNVEENIVVTPSFISDCSGFENVSHDHYRVEAEEELQMGSSEGVPREETTASTDTNDPSIDRSRSDDDTSEPVDQPSEDVMRVKKTTQAGTGAKEREEMVATGKGRRWIHRSTFASPATDRKREQSKVVEASNPLVRTSSLKGANSTRRKDLSVRFSNNFNLPLKEGGSSDETSTDRTEGTGDSSISEETWSTSDNWRSGLIKRLRNKNEEPEDEETALQRAQREMNQVASDVSNLFYDFGDVCGCSQGYDVVAKKKKKKHIRLRMSKDGRIVGK